MTDFNLILEPYKGPASRHTCPACGQKKKFSRYINAGNGQHVADHVGRCDREDNCGYHYKPKEFFGENPETRIHIAKTEKHEFNGPINKPVEYLPFDILSQSVSNSRYCCFYPYLVKLFREDVADQICKDYLIGANKERNTVFWQVDATGKIRQAKVMRYNSETGRRDRETGALFAGKKILNKQDANLQQCFFGEYLLSISENQDKPVALVESEKSACIASAYYPEYVWLATGGKHGAKWTEASVCKVLAGKRVVLFPDVGAFETWKTKGLLISATAGCRLYVSDLLEKYATEDDRLQGLDIADYLLLVQDSSELALTENNYPVIWDLVR